MRSCETCGTTLTRKTRTRTRRGRNVTEDEPLGTFNARRFCDRACKVQAQRRQDGPRRCPRCATTSGDWAPRGSYCRPCSNAKRREAAAQKPERERDYARKKMRNQRANALAEDWIAARCRWAGYRLKASPLELRAIFDQQAGRCALTGAALTSDMHIDHRVPKTRGGTDDLANLRWTTAAANRAKRELLDDEFIALCAAVVATHGSPSTSPTGSGRA